LTSISQAKTRSRAHVARMSTEGTSESPNSEAVLHERRREPRYRLCMPITLLLSEGKAFCGLTIEMSVLGFSAAVGTQLEIGTAVYVRPIAGAEARAKVRRRIGRIHGFEFVDLSPQQWNKLREFLSTRQLYPDNRLGF
jgi:hypothetical protein